MNKTVITCKCNTVYLAEDHPAAGGAVNEIGRWHTCPGCLTTGVIFSSAFLNQKEAAARRRRGEVYCRHCQSWQDRCLKSICSDRYFCRHCRSLLAESFDQIFRYTFGLKSLEDKDLSPRPARDLAGKEGAR